MMNTGTERAAAPRTHRSSARATRFATTVTCATLLVLVALATAAPLAIADDCNIAIRSIGPFEVKRHDLRRPVLRETERGRWHLDETWTSVEPQLNQVLRTRRHGSQYNVSFAAQRTLSIDALPPDTYGWRWTDDGDPSTKCALAGQHAWQAPTVHVVEDQREVRVLAASRSTEGDPSGCSFGDSTSGLPCPNLTTTVVRLARPVGTRRIVFEQFAS